MLKGNRFRVGIEEKKHCQAISFKSKQLFIILINLGDICSLYAEALIAADTNHG